MRAVPVLLIASFATVTIAAAKKDRVWVAGMFGAATFDDWCRTPSSRGPCERLFNPPTPARTTDAPFPNPSTVPMPSPVTEIVKIEGPKATYTVRYQTISDRLPYAPNSPVEFAIRGKHLYLRLDRKEEYKTDILATKKRVP